MFLLQIQIIYIIYTHNLKQLQNSTFVLIIIFQIDNVENICTSNFTINVQ